VVDFDVRVLDFESSAGNGLLVNAIPKKFLDQVKESRASNKLVSCEGSKFVGISLF
jgi:hypothetical protein